MGDRKEPLVADEPAPTDDALEDETTIEGALLGGDRSGAVADLVKLSESLVQTARFTAAELSRATFTDCRFVDCDLSGALLEELRATRVEFVRCRMSGVVLASARLRDVRFDDCKLDDANLRMTTWERSELRDCDLRGADLYAAKLGGTPLEGCDLTEVELSKAELAGSRLHGSRLEGITGGERLRGTVLASDQLVPAAIAVFADLGITLDDEPA